MMTRVIGHSSYGIIVLGNSCYPFFCGKVFNSIDLKRCSRCNTLFAPERAQMLIQSHLEQFLLCPMEACPVPLDIARFNVGVANKID